MTEYLDGEDVPASALYDVPRYLSETDDGVMRSARTGEYVYTAGRFVREADYLRMLRLLSDKLRVTL